MNEPDLLREMGADLQSAPAGKVIYLEGKTDVPIFFALLPYYHAGVRASYEFASGLTLTDRKSTRLNSSHQI